MSEKSLYNSEKSGFPSWKEGNGVSSLWKEEKTRIQNRRKLSRSLLKRKRSRLLPTFLLLFIHKCVYTPSPVLSPSSILCHSSLRTHICIQQNTSWILISLLPFLSFPSLIESQGRVMWVGRREKSQRGKQTRIKERRSEGDGKRNHSSNNSQQIYWSSVLGNGDTCNVINWMGKSVSEKEEGHILSFFHTFLLRYFFHFLIFIPFLGLKMNQICCSPTWVPFFSSFQSFCPFKLGFGPKLLQLRHLQFPFSLRHSLPLTLWASVSLSIISVPLLPSSLSLRPQFWSYPVILGPMNPMPKTKSSSLSFSLRGKCLSGSSLSSCTRCMTRSWPDSFLFHLLSIPLPFQSLHC